MEGNFFRRFWWIGLSVIVVLIGLWAIINFVIYPKQKGEHLLSTRNYPKCPTNLSGVLTAPLMEPKYIAALTPLGNINPPGHTAPVDHIYFTVNSDDKIPLFAPADGWITNVMAGSEKDANGNYNFTSYVLTYTICDGLILDFAGYNDVIQPLKDELAKYKESCKYDIKKAGHENSSEGQCNYNNLNFKVAAGEQLGYVQRKLRPEGGYDLPFEIWAANYNKPARSDVDWSYYDDNRYAHSMCTFDLYAGILKQQFDTKFGVWQEEKNGSGKFLSRTVEPVCGQVNQDVVGTVQGMWFSHKPDKNDKSGNVVASGQGLAFLHNNIDPTKGEVSIGGEFGSAITGVYIFTPTHSGTINREPSEVKADGQIYCYDSNAEVPNYGQGQGGKILVQVTNTHHLKAAYTSGSCKASETLSNLYNFER